MSSKTASSSQARANGARASSGRRSASAQLVAADSPSTPSPALSKTPSRPSRPSRTRGCGEGVRRFVDLHDRRHADFTFRLVGAAALGTRRPAAPRSRWPEAQAAKARATPSWRKSSDSSLRGVFFSDTSPVRLQSSGAGSFSSPGPLSSCLRDVQETPKCKMNRSQPDGIRRLR